MKSGIKTTEFYVVAAILIVWAAKYLGLDLSVDAVQNEVVELAEQLQGIEADDYRGLYLAMIYYIGQKVQKIFSAYRGANGSQQG